jgi:hypothetical protein
MTNLQLSARRAERDKIRSSHPAPWSVEETAACFVVRDRSGQVLTRVYFKDERGRTALFTRDEAQHIAASVAELPELWRKG